MRTLLKVGRRRANDSRRSRASRVVERSETSTSETRRPLQKNPDNVEVDRRWCERQWFRYEWFATFVFIAGTHSSNGRREICAELSVSLGLTTFCIVCMSSLLLLWPPYVIGGALYFCPVISFYLLSSDYCNSLCYNLPKSQITQYTTDGRRVYLIRQIETHSSYLTACSLPEVEISRWRFCKYSLFDVITLVMGKTNI